MGRLLLLAAVAALTVIKNMSNITLRTVTGEVNAAAFSSQVYIYAHRDGRDCPMPRAVVSSSAPSLLAKPARIGGAITDATYTLSEGAVVKVYANRRRGYGKPPLRCVFFIRMREGAALRSINIPLADPSGEHLLNPPYNASLTGTFDIIPVKELSRYDITLPERFLVNASDGCRESMTKETILQEEVSTLPKKAKQVVIASGDAEGSNETITIKKKPRALKLD